MIPLTKCVNHIAQNEQQFERKKYAINNRNIVADKLARNDTAVGVLISANGMLRQTNMRPNGKAQKRTNMRTFALS